MTSGRSGCRSLRLAVLLAMLAAGAIACGGDAEERARPRRLADAPGTIGTLCGFAKPEDVEPIESARVVLVTERGWTSELLRHDGSAIHSVTSAARVGPWTFFGSMGQDRIGMLFASNASAGPAR